MNPDDAKHTVVMHALRECRLFQDLAEKDLLEVAETCVLKSLEKGEYLFREHQKADGFYVMQRGSLNIHRVSLNGQEKVICIVRPYEPFAEITLTTVETYPADAVAIEPSAVILVKKQAFRSLVLEQPELALRMLTSMSFHLKDLVQMIEDLQFKQIEARLANWLVRHCPSAPTTEAPVVHIDTSKKLLASQLGVTSETFSRTLANFRDAGLIEVDGNNITLLNCAGLESKMG